MKKSSVLLLSLILPLAIVRAANHESAQITPIKWIIDTQHNGDVDDKSVTIVGRVVRPDQGSDWWFSDTTGSVRLDAGDKELPVGPMLRVSGHIDHVKFGVGYLEVEVKHWEYADKAPKS